MAEYIEREDAIGAFDNVDADVMEDYGDGADFGFGYRLICDTLKAVPAADVAPVVYGWWVPVTESEMTGWNPEFAGRDPIAGYSCSNCKEEAVFDCNNEFVLTKYCPNCGAKMDGGSVNE